MAAAVAHYTITQAPDSKVKLSCLWLMFSCVNLVLDGPTSLTYQVQHHDINTGQNRLNE
jgi:hypothetical protein